MNVCSKCAANMGSQNTGHCCLSSSLQCAVLGGLSFYSCSLSVEDGILVSIFFVAPFHANICISVTFNKHSMSPLLFQLLDFLLDRHSLSISDIVVIFRAFLGGLDFFLCQFFTTATSGSLAISIECML